MSEKYVSECNLKTLKWQIFDLSDFHDFFTTKPKRRGDLGTEINILFVIFGVDRRH